jgi:hypothetical protein
LVGTGAAFSPTTSAALRYWNLTHRDIAAVWRDIETPCVSLPTRPPSRSRTAARKAGGLDFRKRMRERDGLSAGGSQIRTFAPPVTVSSVVISSRVWVGEQVQSAGRFACMMPREVQELAFAKGGMSLHPRRSVKLMVSVAVAASEICWEIASQAPEQKSPEGIAGVANCNDSLLRSEPEPSYEGRCWHRAIRECSGGRGARLESGSLRHPRRSRHCPRDT